MTGGRINILVDLDTAAAMSQLKTLGGAMGVTLGVAGIAAGFGKVVSLGNDLTNTLNTMQAVSSATADQMAAVSERAKQLGNDMTIPNTSATNAAEAMTELAKGGLSVEQTMVAAKGSLQLAAAAQIDAGTAANIQARALNAFKLEASDATLVADTLANVSNAASGEIGDFAMGLNQSALVAKGLGLSLEDTATTLGLFAKNSLLGSDGGTSLKTMLIALESPSKAQAAALRELGVEQFNAQGQFVGMRVVTEQLAAAQQRMTTEQFTAAAATAFGTDAVRGATALVAEGAAGWDEMAGAITRQGGAAEVAAAKTQGLPGALQRVQNAAETSALALYELVDGPLERLANFAAGGLTSATEAVGNLGSGSAASVPFVQGFVSAWDGLPEVGSKVINVLRPIGEVVRENVEALGQSGGVVETAGQALHGLVNIAGAGLTILTPFAEAVGAVGSFFAGLPGPVQSAVVALVAFRLLMPAITASLATAGAALSRFAITATGQAVGALAAVTTSFTTAAAAATRFGAVGRVVAGGMSVARVGISSLTSALGGPWVLALAAATIGITSWMASNDAAAERAKRLRDATVQIAAAQRDMYKAFTESNGGLSQLALSSISVQVEAVTGKIDTLTESGASWTNYVGDALQTVSGFWANSAGEHTAYLEEQEGRGDRMKAVYQSLGLNAQQLAEQLANDDTWPELQRKLEGAGQGGAELLAELGPLHEEAVRARQDAALLTPGVSDLSAAVKTLADTSSSAEEQLSALHEILDVLSGKQIPLSEAVASYNDTINKVVESTAEAVDQTKGFGDALVGVNGAVNTVLPNGGALFDQLVRLRGESEKVALAAYNQKIQTGTVAEAQQAAREQMARTAEALGPLAAKYGISADQIERMAREAGLVPETIVSAVALQGASESTQELFIINQELAKAGAGASVTVDAPTEDARKQLEVLGVKIEEVAGHPNLVKITAPNETALQQLDQITKVIDSATRTRYVDIVPRRVGSPEQVANAAVLDSGVTFGRPPGLATGGRLPTSGPGTDVVDGFLGMISGMPAVRLDGGEQITRRAMVDKYGPRLFDEINAGTFPMLPGYKDGGRIAVDRMKDFAQSQNGLPYVWGSRDCSWFMSAIQAVGMGHEPGRLYTTHDLMAGNTAGLKSGSQGPFVIGVNDEHMAGDLDGVPVESGGNGVRYGAGALSANDPRFVKQFYMPSDLFDPPLTATSRESSRDDESSTGENRGDRSTAEPDAQGTDKNRSAGQALSDLPQTLSGAAGALASEVVSSVVGDVLGVLGVNDSGIVGKSISLGRSIAEYDPDPTGDGRRKRQQEFDTAPTTDDSDPKVMDQQPISYDSGRGVEQWAPVFAEALSRTGNPSQDLGRTQEQARIESNGNPDAVGPDSADGNPRGLLQVKPATFAAFRDPELANNVLNPLANSVAAMKYTNDRYGNLANIWPTAKGYKDGGIELSPMAAGKASIVGPNTWRVVGDRAKDDEFYIPDTNDPAHVAIGQEWARRRGFQLVRMHADGGIHGGSSGRGAAAMDVDAIVGGVFGRMGTVNINAPTGDSIGIRREWERWLGRATQHYAMGGRS
ncbi:phage tail tape measure protein [Antrihabitans sp. YC3-6]|uniref:Phage tail tape measure protein n=1 Tax=Antrihabitans stalagmiti TaxID=2799499 RepID=A0A934U428_9NOCA|nr:phage tail tape measure protein [Antrihabitans stalagmiti]MBJ8340007.1 phage tail tape measure protein [Antrihabitans stalagmiti]